MKEIIKTYKKYKVNSTKETMRQICNPVKYKLQPQQEFLPEYLWDNKIKINGLLIYHKIGSGKTCTAIKIAEKFKNTYKIIIVLPASLIYNFIDELLSKCVGNIYISEQEKKILYNLDYKSKEYKELYLKIENRINKYYTILSYQKFIDLIQNNKLKLKKTLLIIDEIHNMISITGIFYKILKNKIEKTDNTFKLILLTATPMFDKPNEIALTLNLLKPKIMLPIGIKFNNTFLESTTQNNSTTYKIINLELFKKLTSNMISYYRGAPPQTFPKLNFKIVKCTMSSFQYKSYITSLFNINEDIKGSFKNVDILKLPTNFFLGPRIMSNIAFPNKSIDAIGFASFKDNKLQLKNIKKYSIKFYKIFSRIKKSDGPIFIYSNFKNYGGIKSFIIFIEYHGYKNYKIFGEGLKTYAVWTGDENYQMKEKIKHLFNNKDNINGHKIKILLGSPSIKEGISLLRVDQIHIMEPYWNISRLDQIIGRGVRFCSHKDMPKNKQLVNVFLYLATYLKEKTIDQYIWLLANEKYKIINKFEHLLKENAIDCKLFYARNYYKNDNIKLICN